MRPLMSSEPHANTYTAPPPSPPAPPVPMPLPPLPPAHPPRTNTGVIAAVAAAPAPAPSPPSPPIVPKLPPAPPAPPIIALAPLLRAQPAAFAPAPGQLKIELETSSVAPLGSDRSPVATSASGSEPSPRTRPPSTTSVPASTHSIGAPAPGDTFCPPMQSSVLIRMLTSVSGCVGCCVRHTVYAPSPSQPGGASLRRASIRRPSSLAASWIAGPASPRGAAPPPRPFFAWYEQPPCAKRSQALTAPS